ncbi:hypothetical protein ONZ43_g2342 [Nemania bipapillata]|uniref:Uncharacterized protein n=1 Tax=Nemania bipapillata TaxID=110536 RepID=A0ACC2J111_9PEZI|nr:hypothetical protein ONZ43_g2342 [Nemania bipapillata]
MCGAVVLPIWSLIPDITQIAVRRGLPIFALPTKPEDPRSLTECLRTLSATRRWAVKPGTKLSLRELLARAHPFQATAPRDKVYSVLGLADDINGISIPVDYKCPTEDLYIRVASKIIEKTSDLRLLYSSLHVKSYLLPSWVPDWSTWLFGSHGVAQDLHYKACGSTTTQARVHGIELHISGSVVDRIAYLGEPIGEHYRALDTGLEERKSFIRRELMGLSRWARIPDGRQGLVDVFWRVLIGNLTLKKRPAEEEYASLYRAHLAYDGLGSPDETRAAAQEFCDAVRRRSRYRRLAVMENGHVGAVPETARVNDLVSTFDGKNLLFILRPRGPNFEYIGHAYVHGLMDGEIHHKNWYKQQTIILV